MESFSREMQKKIEIGRSIARVIGMIFSILFINHLFCCLWYFQTNLMNFPDNGWIRKKDLLDSDDLTKYLASFYFSFVTIMGIGFGDIHAYNTIEYIFATIWILFGIAFYSYMIGNVT